MSHSSQPHHWEREREREYNTLCCIYIWLTQIIGGYLHMITVCLEDKPISVLVSLSISEMMAEE